MRVEGQIEVWLVKLAPHRRSGIEFATYTGTYKCQFDDDYHFI
jgi:hypothetical protein